MRIVFPDLESSQYCLLNHSHTWNSVLPGLCLTQNCPPISTPSLLLWKNSFQLPDRIILYCLKASHTFWSDSPYINLIQLCVTENLKFQWLKTTITYILSYFKSAELNRNKWNSEGARDPRSF